MRTENADDNATGPWNPDIKSSLPVQYLALSTMFRPENVYTSLDTASELSDFTGLPIQKLIFFRPERLVVHELLVRISADIFVSDGSRYEDLGVNYRSIVDVILGEYIQPQMPSIVRHFDTFKQQIRQLVDSELGRRLFADSPVVEKRQAASGIARFFKSNARKSKTPRSESAEIRHQQIVSDWQQQSGSEQDRQAAAVYLNLYRIANAIIIQHGRLMGDRSLLTELVTGLVCNQLGSEIIGEMIAPLVQQAAAEKDYLVLPAQQEPVVINIKGASAAGKSTMRPLQHQHTDLLGLNWHDFALISPDIWRKYLLDYDSLGEAYKYAGTLAGDEIPVIDKKLDRYISEKARQGRLSHLLIDRFRFDSFAPGHDSEEGSNLLTRFGHTIYLTFMVTPPAATVERAWIRGQQVGRYKAVDDLLDHNIEAYKGMPVIFFTWVLNPKKTVYFEFLDNSVDYGEKPSTVAFGSNNEMYVLNFKCLLDIQRYTKINIEASNPAEVFPEEMDFFAENNVDFLVNCCNKIPTIYFVEPGSCLIYAQMDGGKIVWANHKITSQVLDDRDTRLGFQVIAPQLLDNLEQTVDQSSRTVPAAALRQAMGNTGC